MKVYSISVYPNSHMISKLFIRFQSRIHLLEESRAYSLIHQKKQEWIIQFQTRSVILQGQVLFRTVKKNLNCYTFVNNWQFDRHTKEIEIRHKGKRERDQTHRLKKEIDQTDKREIPDRQTDRERSYRQIERDHRRRIFAFLYTTKKNLFISWLFWLAGEVSWLAVEVLSPCQKWKSRYLKQNFSPV